MIEVSLQCCDKVANFSTYTHPPELYLLSFGSFFQIIYNIKSGYTIINITQPCVYLCQNLLLYQNNTIQPQFVTARIYRVDRSGITKCSVNLAMI